VADLIDQLAAQCGAVMNTARTKPFAIAAARFADTLATIPDYPASDMSHEAFARVNAIAEQVIAQIEERLDAGAIDDTTGEHLADTIYEIRRGLEEAFRWRKHYLGA